MSVELLGTRDGFLTIRVSGKLNQEEWVNAQKGAAETLQREGRSRVLILADNFEGWERGADWSELSGQMELDANMQRMAIVGEKKWEDLALLFSGKGVRRVNIEFFTPQQAAKAQQWLTAD
jgi:hypothetical protein